MKLIIMILQVLALWCSRVIRTAPAGPCRQGTTGASRSAVMIARFREFSVGCELIAFVQMLYSEEVDNYLRSEDRGHVCRQYIRRG